MNTEEPKGIIELGDINIKCLIFKINNNKDLEILSTSIIPSEGIRNDLIVNLDKATKAIRLSISNAEKIAKISLKKINIVFEQPDFLCTKFSKNKRIDGSKISREDIEFLIKEAKKQLILNDKNQSIIHIFNHNYIVDGKTFIEEPIGIYADFLTHEITFITVPKNNLRNIKQALADCDIEIERCISRTFSLGVELFNHNELQSSAALINFGFEKTSLGLFRNLALAHSITFPIGVNHIIKDLSKVCSLNLDESKNIINNFDFSFQKNEKVFDNENFLKKNFFIDTNFRKISKNLIINIIKARLDEIIESIKKQLAISEFDFTSAITFTLQGGSNLNNVIDYFSNTFEQNFKTTEKNEENKNMSFKDDFSSCLGSIKIIKDGWETEAIPKVGEKSVEKRGFFAKIFGT